MMINEYVYFIGRSFLFVVGTLLPIVNPPAVTPIFWAMTSGASNSTRALLAKRIAINVLIMLIFATVAGNVILSFFGISLPIVSVAGGLLVVASAWQLLNAKDNDTVHAEKLAEQFTLEKVKAHAFFPLTFPITCGPGSIAAAITVGATLQSASPTDSLLNLTGTLTGIIVVAVVVYLCLRYAAQFLYKLGSTGTAVFMRLSAFILFCIGVQIVWNGAYELIMSLSGDIAKLKP
ncbi:MAG: MarC family protein [Advenella sp.]|nr:MarC family protein [Advenella sp.]